MKAKILAIGIIITLLFSANIAPAQTESENAKAIAEINEALKKQTALISNLMNQPQTAGGLTRDEVRKMLADGTVQLGKSAQRGSVEGILITGGMGRDEVRNVANEYFRLIAKGDHGKALDFFLNAVEKTAAGRKSVLFSAPNPVIAPSPMPSKDYDGEIKQLKKEIADLTRSQEFDREYFDLYFREVVDRLDGTIDEAMKTTEDQFAKYGEELEDVKSAVEKKADKGDIPTTIEGLRTEIGGDLWTLARNLNDLIQMIGGGKGLRSDTVAVVGIPASFMGRDEPVKTTKEGEKIAARVEKSTAEIMMRWEKYK